MKYLVAVLLALSLAAGCATSPIVQGNPITSAKLSQIKPGETKVDALAQILGRPVRTERVAGTEKYIYQYFKEVPQVLTKNEIVKETLVVTVVDGLVTKYDLNAEGIAKVQKGD